MCERLDGSLAAIVADRPGWGDRRTDRLGWDDRRTDRLGWDDRRADRPGSGHREAPTGLDGNARAALRTLDARGVGRAVLVGHSFGGAVAAWLAATHPQRVSALVLLAPAANLQSLSAADRLLALPLVGECLSALVLGGVGLGLASGGVRRRLASARGVDSAYLAAAGRAVRRPSAWLANACEQRALVAELPALERMLPSIRAPTTILAGARDRIVPPAAVRSLAAVIPGARLEILPRAGHLLPQREPAIVAAAIADAAGARRPEAPPSGG